MLLTPHALIAAYSRGFFPIALEEDVIYWYDPDPRAIIPLDDRFHVPRRLQRVVRNGKFEVRVDTCFREVMEACARPGPGREETWISARMVEAYETLHRMGRAHSVEAWYEGQLAGGLYGVALGGLFAGESMFSYESEASKVALVHLVERLRQAGFVLLDTQFVTAHLSQFGTIEVSRKEYKQQLAHALRVSAVF